eukprot:2516991-Pleurochrysis_carterae.AAC.1
MSTNTSSQRSGSGRRCGGWAHLRVVQGKGRSASRGGHRERVSKSFGSGARALRKYACDTIAKQQTVHVSVRLLMKGARDDSL